MAYFRCFPVSLCLSLSEIRHGFGKSSLPEKWVEKLVLKEIIQQLGIDLFLKLRPEFGYCYPHPGLGDREIHIFYRALVLFTATYMHGIKNRATRISMPKPPMAATAMGWSMSPPSPIFIARGRNPIMVVTDVMILGRSRIFAASVTA
jgi:hypothetical protein